METCSRVSPIIRLIDEDGLGDVWSQVLNFLDAQSLLQAAMGAKILQGARSDELWYSLSHRRWRVALSMKRVLGVTNWQGAYRLLAKRQKVPRGVFTEKHNKCYGAGRSRGIDCWLFIKHSSSSRPYVTKSGVPVIYVRLCVQNVNNVAFLFRPSSIETAFRTESIDIYEPLTLLSSRIVAFNGLKFMAADTAGGRDSDADNLVLGPLDFCVALLQLVVPTDITYETDFLARIAWVDLHGKCGSGEDLTVRCNIIDEHDIWESYVELPGGVVLHRDESSLIDM
jgi:hypothetical protein